MSPGWMWRMWRTRTYNSLICLTREEDKIKQEKSTLGPKEEYEEGGCKEKVRLANLWKERQARFASAAKKCDLRKRGGLV
jgi:hypothetical protein